MQPCRPGLLPRNLEAPLTERQPRTAPRGSFTCLSQKALGPLPCHKQEVPAPSPPGGMRATTSVSGFWTKSPTGASVKISDDTRGVHDGVPLPERSKPIPSPRTGGKSDSSGRLLRSHFLLLTPGGTGAQGALLTWNTLRAELGRTQSLSHPQPSVVSAPGPPREPLGALPPGSLHNPAGVVQPGCPSSDLHTPFPQLLSPPPPS